MSKITSWDKRADGEGYTYHESYIGGALLKPARLVLWPEGAPDPSTVPHANERVEIIDPEEHESYMGTVENGIPQKEGDKWRMDVRGDSHGLLSEVLAQIHRISDSPTVTLSNGKQYRERDVIERCAELEEV